MDLDLSKYHEFLKIEKRASERYIFDPIRKDYLLVQPEELVRQSWVQYLIRERNISAASIAVEKQIKLFNEAKRFDLLLYSKGIPQILFEFKSFKTKITESTCQQVAAYNFELKVPYIIISNGLKHLAYAVNFEDHSIEEINHFPDLS